MKEKIFSNNVSWGKVDKTPWSLQPGTVVKCNTYMQVYTFDGAGSTYLKPEQLGVIIADLGFGERYLVSWQIGAGYIANCPMAKQFLDPVPPKVENLKLDTDEHVTDILTKIVTNPAMKLTNMKKAFQTFKSKPMQNFFISVLNNKMRKNSCKIENFVKGA